MAFEDATLFSASRARATCCSSAAGLRRRARRCRPRRCEIAQARLRLRRCPTALDTTIGEEGLSLSGRPAAAPSRSPAPSPPGPAVLVLDDPLSALDVDTEAPVSRRRCARCSATTTALIVAHRPSTVALADRVALLEDGRITAVGRALRACSRRSRALPVRHLVLRGDDRADARRGGGRMSAIDRRRGRGAPRLHHGERAAADPPAPRRSCSARCCARCVRRLARRHGDRRRSAPACRRARARRSSRSASTRACPPSLDRPDCDADRRASRLLYLTAAVGERLLIGWYTMLAARVSQALLFDLRGACSGTRSG